MHKFVILKRLCARIAGAEAGSVGSQFAKFIPFDNSCFMFCRRIAVAYEVNGQRRPCKLKWLDSFAMRNFTNYAVFDDTLPISDGLIEIGARVPIEALRGAMEDWFHRKSYLEKQAHVVVKELA